MLMPRPAFPLSLLPDQRRIMEAWRDSPSTPRQVVLRSQIILLVAAGASNRAIALALPSTLVTVLLWRNRFREGGAQALIEIEPGGGPEWQISRQKVREFVEATRMAVQKIGWHMLRRWN
jgi:transposase